ncbi:hypothetical protein GCM10012286_55540 [Streptomyces lasiicapitis]|uniref:Uncharacterized protein n=1 Tax=Streptomyces lasiicapitis TaxID=1923961 RepID=A0ABQ2MG33_9ACTN|nr:hypothetical protein GCM10012286_55540 [Streptomyces lasiicapitis]
MPDNRKAPPPTTAAVTTAPIAFCLPVILRRWVLMGVPASSGGGAGWGLLRTLASQRRDKTGLSGLGR